MDNVIILLSCSRGTVCESYRIFDDGDVVGGETKVFGCERVDYWVDFYNGGADTVGDEGGWGGAYSKTTL
jgi:hypothetical protein